MKLVLLGAPGAGKGTQAEILSRMCNIPAISTGHILRSAMKNGTPVGLKAKEYVESGKLVPDEVIVGIIEERLAEDDCKNGYILDGVPRTVPQAQSLDEKGVLIDTVLHFDISDDEIVGRMCDRRVCKECSTPYHLSFKPPKTEGTCDNCGGELAARGDDAPETVRKRLEVYHRETSPLIEFYNRKGVLKTARAMSGIEETTAEVKNVLGIR